MLLSYELSLLTFIADFEFSVIILSPTSLFQTAHGWQILANHTKSSF